jgi:hypothetical protein
MANFAPGPERDKRLEWLARAVSGRQEAMRALQLFERDPSDDLQPPQGGRCAKAQSWAIPDAEEYQQIQGRSKSKSGPRYHMFLQLEVTRQADGAGGTRD